MLTEREIRAYKSLCHAILLSAIKDAKSIREHTLLKIFIESSWCELLCDSTNIDYRSYRNKVAERMAKVVEKSRPKRLQTYVLVKVLNGRVIGEEKHG